MAKRKNDKRADKKIANPEKAPPPQEDELKEAPRESDPIRDGAYGAAVGGLLGGAGGAAIGGALGIAGGSYWDDEKK